MKLQSYEALCAADIGDYCRIGQIMAEHFGVPELYYIAREATPSFVKTPSTPKYAVSIISGGRGYHWFSSLGFVMGSADYKSDGVHFDIVVGAGGRASLRELK